MAHNLCAKVGLGLVWPVNPVGKLEIPDRGDVLPVVSGDMYARSVRE